MLSSRRQALEVKPLGGSPPKWPLHKHCSTHSEPVYTISRISWLRTPWIVVLQAPSKSPASSKLACQRPDESNLQPNMLICYVQGFLPPHHLHFITAAFKLATFSCGLEWDSSKKSFTT